MGIIEMGVIVIVIRYRKGVKSEGNDTKNKLVGGMVY